MAEDPAQVSVATDGAIAARQIAPLAQIDLRLDPGLVAHMPYPLPLTPNTAHEDGGLTRLWLGPDEWLILGAPHEGARMVAELRTSLTGLHRSIVDVGANRVIFELSGPGRLDLLSKGCSLDLHPSRWTAGMCAQTLLAKTQVVLHERADATRVLVRPSFADYLIEWLTAAAR
jgi:sarcosine oxidase subunit gamma